MTKIHIHGGDVYRNPGILDFSANCNLRDAQGREGGSHTGA